VTTGGGRVGASNVLALKADLVMAALHAAQYQLWSGPAVAQRYERYLVAMHGVIRASVPLMEAAVRRCRNADVAGRLATGLDAYLSRHIEEERGHDEWLRQDLAALGADPDELLRRAPDAVVAQLVGAQYYWIAHAHPAIVLGYIWLLESYPPAPAFIDELQRRTGHPAAAFRTLRRHADLDPGHRAELAALLDMLRPGPRTRAAIDANMLHSVGALTELFRRLARQA
jgi:pyrroloquinoline quinone (PQQ) biosynthesis protein C